MSRFLLEFLTRTGCHLCEDARPIVEAAAERHGFGVAVVDIESDDELVGLYGLRIPVVLSPEGEVIAEGLIEPNQLRRALRRASRRRIRLGRSRRP